MLKMNILKVASFMFFAMFIGHGVSAVANKPYKTGYHFQPPKSWISDPAGIIVYKGIYHLFYLQNPDGPVWGNLQWSHSTSSDLVNWNHHQLALYSSQHSDVNSLYSGSVTILPAGPAILYTGVNSKNREVQNLAFPKNLSDLYLSQWIKWRENPVITAPQNLKNASSFNAPSTAWIEVQFRIKSNDEKKKEGNEELTSRICSSHAVQVIIIRQ